jgi:hypothetical protein
MGKGTGRPRNYASVREVARTKRPEDGSRNTCTRMRVPRSVVAFADPVPETVHFRFWSKPKVGPGSNDSGPQTVYVPPPTAQLESRMLQIATSGLMS